MTRTHALFALLLAACAPDPKPADDAARPRESAAPADSATGETGASGDTGEPLDTGAEGDLLATEILVHPTDRSVGLSAVPGVDLELYVELGTASGEYATRTETRTELAGEPFELSLSGLAPDTRYYYRLRWRAIGESAFSAGPERGFHTARAAGQPFVFVIQADPHLDDKSSLDLYQITLANELADAPDFLIDLGDTFMCEKHCTPFVGTNEDAADYETVAARYLYERGNFGLVAHSAPLFLVNGNHEGESGWLLDGTEDNIAVWATLARKAYYPGPSEDGFYTTSDTEEPVVGTRQSWYAWTWGDALFIVLDPYWYTTSRSTADGWVWTLGEEQYRWLAQTLEESDARFRFVFLHQLVGGVDEHGRGGVEAAPYYEWGGLSADGSEGFAVNRPGWDAPIHQLLVDQHVTAVFHGHDHVYVKQELDGVVYQELPQPSATNFNNAETLAAEGRYESGTILGSSGHLRVSVGPDEVQVEYVRAWRPEDEDAERHNGDLSDRYTLTAR